MHFNKTLCADERRTVSLRKTPADFQFRPPCPIFRQQPFKRPVNCLTDQPISMSAISTPSSLQSRPRFRRDKLVMFASVPKAVRCSLAFAGVAACISTLAVPGLKAADAPAASAYMAAGKTHWSFQPVHAYPAPQVKDAAWCTNDIDQFILAKLEENQLKPVVPADRKTLIRRATFDLIGLPPTLEEIDAFEKDGSPVHSRRSSIGCSIRHTMASDGEGTGSIWRDIPMTREIRFLRPPPMRIPTATG